MKQGGLVHELSMCCIEHLLQGACLTFCHFHEGDSTDFDEQVQCSI